MVAKPEQADELFVSIAQAAILCNVSYWTMWRKVNKGELPSVPFGRIKRIPKAAVLRLVPPPEEEEEG